MYHYTDYDASFKILNNCSFWFSNVYCLNDKKEIIYGKDLIFDKLDKKINIIKSTELVKIKNLFSENLKNIFLLCLSFNNDSLHHWRSYGEVNLGIDFNNLCICIGSKNVEFSSNDDKKHVRKIDCFYVERSKVIYDNKQHEQYISFYIDKLVYLYKNFYNPPQQYKDIYEKFNQIVEMIILRLCEACIFF